MKLSMKSRYGLRALIDLSVNSKNEQVALGGIAERNNISPQYLEQVFASLRKAGIVKSIKGSQGGYFLNNEESQNVIIASGKEVELAINISKRLKDIGINVSVFSMPCINKFFEEDEKYQKELLKKTRKLVIEYSNDPIWYRIVNNKKNIMSINEFGKSGKKNDVLKSFSLDEDSLYIKSKKIFK